MRKWLVTVDEIKGTKMNPKLSARLSRCTTLPTLPAVATDLIELGRDPDASIEQAVTIIQMDPALCTKILRMANSALYTRGQPCEDFRQAVVKLGLNATMTIVFMKNNASKITTAATRTIMEATPTKTAMMNMTIRVSCPCL